MQMAARVPISAADVARLLEAMGVDRVVAVDLHCGQIQGFFGPRVPVDNLQGGVVGVDYFAQMDLQKPVIVSPDAGGVYRVKKFRDGMMTKHGIDAGVAMIIKQRGKPGQIDSMDLVGDIEDCDCIIVDDMIDTAGTLCKAANQLKEHGGRRGRWVRGSQARVRVRLARTVQQGCQQPHHRVGAGAGGRAEHHSALRAVEGES